MKNPSEESEISHYGETVTVSFIAEAGWEADLVTADGGSWARITRVNGNDGPGRGSIRVMVDQSEAQTARTADIYVTVQGYARRLLCTLVQESALGAQIDLDLNGKMHEILARKYLWNTSYNRLYEEGEIEMAVPYDEFLSVNLMKLGEENIEDGGRYKAYSSLAGERYVYSYIQEVGVNTKSPVTRSPSTYYGLGMGPTNMVMYTPTERCLLLGYVYQGSPAEKAGLRRGDMIIEINGQKLTASNGWKLQQELYYTSVGTYNLKYARYDDDGMKFREYAASVSAGAFTYNPILFPATFANDDKSVNIGYLVLESFDLPSVDILTGQLEQFKSEGIKDLILDLRFNPGGSVPVCRYLLSSIVGPSHYDDVFAKFTFNDGSIETQTYGYGNKKEPDGLGQGPDLGLKRLYVICSENTGSAAEIVINSLKGIGFEVHTCGSRTEGKNVGMVTEMLSYAGRRFEFAPITFFVANAQGNGDYADGIAPDRVLNNQNTSYDDDISVAFPYEPSNWGNQQGDAAVIWAISMALEGRDPFDDAAMGATTKSAGARRFDISVSPVKNAPYPLSFGRYGSLICGEE